MGNRLKELRELAGLSLEDLAQRVRVDRSAVWKWERKARLDAAVIRRLADALNVHPMDLTDGAVPLGPDERELLNAYRCLNSDQRDMARRMLHAIAEKT